MSSSEAEMSEHCDSDATIVNELPAPGCEGCDAAKEETNAAKEETKAAKEETKAAKEETAMWKSRYEQLNESTKHTPGHPKFARQQLRRRRTPPAAEISQADNQKIFMHREDIREARAASKTPGKLVGQLMSLIFRSWALECCTHRGRNGYLLNGCGIKAVCYLVKKRGINLRRAKEELDQDEDMDWRYSVTPKNVQKHWTREACSKISIKSKIDGARTVARRRAAQCSDGE